MKRFIVVCMLATMLAGCVPPARAESNPALQVEIDYEGAWVSFGQECFKIYLPADWVIVQTDASESFNVLNGTLTQRMWIDMFPSEGFTMDGLLASFKDMEGFERVGAVAFNGVPFVAYSLPESDMFGAVTMTADGTRILFFKFMPQSDPELELLATKIMASLTPVK